MAEPIIERIYAAFQRGEKKLTYHQLAHRVFPVEDYPRAWRSPTRGGPPGCFMALSAALRRHSIYWAFEPVGSFNRVVYRPTIEPSNGR